MKCKYFYSTDDIYDFNRCQCDGDLPSSWKDVREKITDEIERLRALGTDKELNIDTSHDIYALKWVLSILPPPPDGKERENERI